MGSLTPPEAAVPRSDTGLMDALVATLRRDRLAQLALGLCVSSFLFFLFPVVGVEVRQTMTRHALPLLFLGLTLAALLSSLRDIESPEERRFWIDLAWAYGCWLASRLINLLVPATLPSSIAEDLLYGLFYLCMVMALERRVHRRSEWRPTRLERALTWPGVGVFILGILLYFVYIPLRGNPQEYLDGLPSMHFYVCMDIYLTLTIVYLSRTSHSRRWRILYSMMTVAVATTLVSDLSEVLGFFRGWSLGGPLDGLWTLPLVAMILTARMRHVRIGSLPKHHYDKLAQEGNLSGPNGRTMVMALAFPMAHFAGYSSGILEPTYQTQRAVLIFVWLVLLGGISWVQHRILSRSFEAIVQDRAHFEESLRNSQKDLRFMIERHHTSEQLRLSELKFFKAFRASPDVMVISSVDDGRLIEVNDSFERILGYRREETVGRTVAELGIWEVPEKRRQMTDKLQAHGNLREIEVRFVRRNGDVGIALFSAELITIDDEPCLLSVAHDISDRRAIESRLQKETDDLRSLDNAVAVTDLDHHIVFWNDAAEDLFGWPETEVLRQNLLDVMSDEPNGHWQQGGEQVQRLGHWHGRLTARRRDDRHLHIEAWWSRVRNERDLPQPRLLWVSQPIAAETGGAEETGDAGAEA